MSQSRERQKVIPQLKNLNVFLFHQNWYSLGSLIESINFYKDKFNSINIYFINRKLIVKPLDLHFNFPGSGYLGKKPEDISAKYLSELFRKSSVKFKFDFPVLSQDISIEPNLDSIKDIKSLKSLNLKNTSLGMPILSFLITMTKDSAPNITKHKKLIKKLSLTYLQIFDYLDSLSLSNSSDEVWVWNGRPFHDRTIVEYARKKNITIKFMEIGGEGINQSRWILHKDSPHNRVKHQKSIATHYNCTKPVKKNIDFWYESQKPGGTNNFSTNFVFNENLVKLKNVFVFYSSSSDEVSAISLDWDSWFENQIEAVKFLIDYFEQRPELTLVIRVHPNQKHKSKTDRVKWHSIQSAANNIFIYDYNSKIDSYQLLELAKGVLTYGSSMGVEAAYMSKPGALLAKSRWDLIIPHKYIKNKMQLDRWISDVLNNSLSIKAGITNSYMGSLKWGHYMITSGLPWQIIEVRKDFRGINIGYLNGISLKPNSLIIIFSRLSQRIRLFLLKRI